MAEFETRKCSGCLSTDRKLLHILDADKLTCFSQILCEIEWSSLLDRKIWLCWECHGRISSFARFKQRILRCHRALNLPTDKAPPTSNLSKEQQISLSYSPESKEIEDEIFEIVKPRILKLKEELLKDIKSSFDDKEDSKICDDYFGDEDDVSLIVLSKRERGTDGIERKKRKVLSSAKKRSRKKKLIEPKEETEIYREIVLDRDGIEKERRERETGEDYVNAMFKCEKCIVTFPNKDDMVEHEESKHLLNASKHVCDICSRSFATEVSYNYHTNRHRKRYECMSCMARFISKGAVERHVVQIHGIGIPLEQPKGGILENSVTEKTDINDEDISKRTNTTEFPCGQCDKVFKWKTSLRKHSETHRIEAGHKRRPYCEPCKLSFTTTANLQKHVRTSSKHQIQLKLRKLKESGESVEKEAVKLEVSAARATHTCPHCGAAFQWRGNLRRHLMTHTARARGELVCKPCNRTFSSIATYTQHMTASRRHVTENEFKYMCSECGKKFANKTRLRDHVDWEHLKSYRHTCSECGKVFRSDTSLKLHCQAVHSKEPAHRLCHHCGRGFPNLGKLRTHISAVHSALAAFCCAECGARFSWHSCLSRHVRRVHRAGQNDNTHTRETQKQLD